jgi:hypothetical protein
MNLPSGKKLFILIFILPVLFLCFCLLFSAPLRAFLHGYAIALTIKFDHKMTIENEKNVILNLKDIVQNYGDYSMRAFSRKAISYKVQKTSETTHSFYVIYKADGTYNTLSYSATGKFAVSKGAWAMNTEGDISSYTEYSAGNNRWEVEEYTTKNGINTLLTINNVLEKTQSNIKYFFRAKINKNDKYDNCNTGVLETLVENDG